MKNSEAIKIIRKMDRTDLTPEEVKALNLAVRALKCQRPTGSWEIRHISDSNGVSKYRLICNICGRDLFLLYSQDIPDFCSYCGADMRRRTDDYIMENDQKTFIPVEKTSQKEESDKSKSEDGRAK